MPTTEPGLLRPAVAVFMVMVGYYLGTMAGFAMTPADTPIATFWPPNAILLSVLLLSPPRTWWRLLVAVIPAHLLAQSGHGVPLATSLGWLIGNASEALVGATLICMAPRGADLRRTGGVTRFLLFGFFLGPLLTSFIDAAVVVGTQWGRDFWVLWTIRLFSNMLATLTIVPTVVGWGRSAPSWIKGVSSRTWREASLLAAGVVIVAFFVFWREQPPQATIPAVMCLPLPILLWAALRFGPAGVSASLLVIAVVSLSSVMHGRGPFMSPSIAGSVLSLQVFLSMIGTPLLLLAAITTDHRLTEGALQNATRKLVEAQERERRGIARQLHDDIGQRLTLAHIELVQLVRGADRASLGSLDRLRDQLDEVSKAAGEISHDLYPVNLEFLGLGRALERLCAEVGQKSALAVGYTTRDLPSQLPAEVELCLYRVAQEALQNIVRHSHASHVSVHIDGVEHHLSLKVRDDGVGFDDIGVVPGFGLTSMRERLKAVHGGVDVQSVPGRGTQLHAWVALNRATA